MVTGRGANVGVCQTLMARGVTAFTPHANVKATTRENRASESVNRDVNLEKANVPVRAPAIAKAPVIAKTKFSGYGNSASADCQPLAPPVHFAFSSVKNDSSRADGTRDD
ncbi:MAG: hypothetical protein CMJ50_02845 [Planctomycetaceae bacterium]|jgi:hypothetical protein|nr:hypothetical protein [Planctomycetaceae bacterium]